jgi:hypothetical protein
MSLPYQGQMKAIFIVEPKSQERIADCRLPIADW